MEEPKQEVETELLETTDEDRETVASVLESLPLHTDEELRYLINEAKVLIKSRKENTKIAEVQEAIAKYAEVNELGKRIYNFSEVAKLTGVSVARIKKALKEQNED